VEAHPSSILLLIPLFPLIGAMINAFIGVRLQEKYGKRAVHGIAILMPSISALLSWIVFFQLMALSPESRALSQVGWDWMHIGFADARFALWADPLSSLMTLIITTIGTLIHVYSVGYMAEEPAYWRFFCYLNLFLTMMLILVLGDNFLVMFIGWEGVGLASYLLIGFWYKELANAGSGMKAFIVNRFGDAFFVIGLFALFWGLQGAWAETPHTAATYAYEAGAKHEEDAIGARPVLHHEGQTIEVEKPHATLTFNRLRAIMADEKRVEEIEQKTIFGLPLLFFVCVCFFLGATAKSAQIPFYVWLPDAMAGPTPVSALIHAATMVTAGVYMIARLNFLFVLSPGACTVVGLIGAATAFFAATMGLFQYDIKKVLAYSTVSQLGFMFIGVGVGAYWAGMFHLLTHACFKACLFLGSGSVILGCHHEQDMRRMGGLKKLMPATALTYAFACFAIAGFPFAAGFCSKDEILWKAFTSSAVLPAANYAIWALGLAAATLTAFYMYRSYYMTFTGAYRGNETPLVDPYPADSARARDLFIPKPVRGPTKEMLEALAAHGHAHGEADAHAPGHDPHHLHHDPHGAHGHDAHGAHDTHDEHGHGHGPHVPHESPWTMTMPLWVLGGASLIIGVIVGFPQVLPFHIPPLLEHWLEPALAPGMEMIAKYDVLHPNVGFLKNENTLHLWEMGLAALSVVVALTGFLSARWFYKDNANPLPERLLHSTNALVRNVHRLIYNKYFVDEAFYTVMVRGMSRVWNGMRNFDVYVIDGVVNGAAVLGRTAAYIQGAIDKYLVDGAVNLVADIVMATGGRLRHLQTGQIRTYLLGAFGGAVAAALLLIAFS
jgi:NADH-quinone oxidoreductase subunit L